jgi:hypothetical protein
MIDTLINWFVEFGYEAKLAASLLASFLLYVIASQLAWQYRYPGRDDIMGRWVDRARDQPLLSLMREATRFIYYLGIPFLAILTGLLGADLMGINGTDWVPQGKSVQGFLWEDWARGLGLAATAVLAMWGVWLAGRSLSRRAELSPVTPGIPGSAWGRLLGALYDQMHWAFYRSGPILWLNDPYWGAFAGLALVLLELGLNPAQRWALQSPETAGPVMARLGIAWVSALLFLETHNLWLTVAAHLVLAVLISYPSGSANSTEGSTEPSA